MHQCAVVMDRQLTVMSDGGSLFNDARAPGSASGFMPSSFIVTSRLHHPVCCVVCGTSPTTQCAVWNWKLGGTWCLVRCRWGQLLQSRFSQSVRACAPAWPSVGLIASLTILDAVPWVPCSTPRVHFSWPRASGISDPSSFRAPPPLGPGIPRAVRYRSDRKKTRV